jgi:hypothetical protein
LLTLRVEPRRHLVEDGPDRWEVVGEPVTTGSEARQVLADRPGADVEQVGDLLAVAILDHAEPRRRRGRPVDDDRRRDALRERSARAVPVAPSERVGLERVDEDER